MAGVIFRNMRKQGIYTKEKKEVELEAIIQCLMQDMLNSKDDVGMILGCFWMILG